MPPRKVDLTDHDMVLTTHENVKFIREKIGCILTGLEGHDKRIDNLESWTDKASIILKIVGLSSIIGGASAAGAKIAGLI